MKKLYKPKNEVELSFIKSILDGEGIPFFVHNDHFGSLQIGPQIDLFNAKMIMVHEEYHGRAKELIADFLNNAEDEAEISNSQYSLFDKVRMISEAIVFTWFIPGKRKKK